MVERKCVLFFLVALAMCALYFLPMTITGQKVAHSPLSSASPSPQRVVLIVEEPVDQTSSLDTVTASPAVEVRNSEFTPGMEVENVAWFFSRNNGSEIADRGFLTKIDGTRSIGTLSQPNFTFLAPDVAGDNISLFDDNLAHLINNNDTEYPSAEIFLKLRHRARMFARRRLRTVHRLTVASEDMSRAWVRCVLLAVTDLGGEWDLKEHPRGECIADWRREVDDCKERTSALVGALKASNDSLLSSLKEVYFTGNTSRQISKRHMEDLSVVDRPLQVVEFPGNWSNEGAGTIAAQLRVNSWKCSSIRELQRHKTSEDIPNSKEGVCHSVLSRFSASWRGGNYSVELPTPALLRIMLRLDAEDLLADEATREGSRCGTQLPLNRVITFMRRSRWLFDSFHPYMTESAGFVSVPLRDDALPMNATLFSSDLDLDTTFRIRPSRKVASGAQSNRMNQLIQPLYYEMNNVCLSPDGHGLSAYTPTGHPRPSIPDELRDERRTKFRRLTIRKRSKPPEFFSDIPLFLTVVTFQSDNLGHVMYRTGGQQSLIHRHLKRHFNASQVVLGHLVHPNAVKTFGVRSSLRHFYQLWNQRWLSVGWFGQPGQEVKSEGNELCFRRAIIGHDALFMYHSQGSSPMLRKRFMMAAQFSQRNVELYFQFLRSRIATCFQSNFQNELDHARESVVSIFRPPSNTVRILVIQRASRRLANLDRLLAALTLEFGSVDPSTGRITLRCPHSGRYIEVLVVDFEDLATPQQVFLFQNADIVFGIHGTAFQWMFLMKPGSVIAEVQYHALGCVTGGLHTGSNSLITRVFCEFGKTSLASQLTHISTKSKDIFGDGHVTRYNVILQRGVFLSIINASLCSVEKGYGKASACRNLLLEG